MDSKIPPDPTAAGGFPNSSDTNEDDEDEPVAAAVVDEEEEEDDAGMEDPSIASNNRAKTLTEKPVLERRGRRNRKEKWALNKALKWYDPGLRALRMGRSQPFIHRTAAKGCVPRVRERRRKSGGVGVGPVRDKGGLSETVAMGPGACCSVNWWGPLEVGIWSPRAEVVSSCGPADTWEMTCGQMWTVNGEVS